MENLHSIKNETVLKKDDSSVVLEFTVPAESDFFDGHFPQFKILPAVGQFEIITRFAGKYFNVSRSVSSIKRIKFSAPVLPETKVQLQLDYNSEKNSVAFKMLSAADEAKIFSSGTFGVKAHE